MAFLGLSCLLWMLYLSGKLFQLFYQALIDEAKRFHFVCIGLHCFHCPGGLLPISSGGSCILGGLVLLLIVFRVDTISN